MWDIQDEIRKISLANNAGIDSWVAVAGRVNGDVSKVSERARGIVKMEEEEKVQPPLRPSTGIPRNGNRN